MASACGGKPKSKAFVDAVPLGNAEERFFDSVSRRFAKSKGPGHFAQNDGPREMSEVGNMYDRASELDSSA